MYHALKATSKVVYQYMLDMTSGGTTQSGRFFFGSTRNTARNLSMSESTAEASFKELIEFWLISYPSQCPEYSNPPGDEKHDWSEFGSRNYVVLTHDEWAAMDGGLACLSLKMVWED